MMSCELITCQPYELFYRVVKTFLHCLRNYGSEKGLIALSGGTTIQRFLKVLGEEDLETFGWKKWHFCEIDSFSPTQERPIPNAEVLRQFYFDAAVAHGIVSPKNIHWFPYDHPIGFCAATEKYEKEVLCVSGKLNIVVFGCGGGVYFPNGPIDPGHCMGLFPGHSELWDIRDRSFVCVDNAPKPPARRMTATPHAVCDADYAIGILTGESRENTLQNFLNPDVSPIDCPIKILNDVKGASYLFTDISAK